MDGFVITAALMKLAYVAAALALLVTALRLFDGWSGQPFSAALKVMSGDARAMALYRGLRFVGVCLLAGLVIGCSAAAASVFPATYDRDIARAVALYWPAYPFPASWKAQLWQESRLDPAAVSPVGARGLAQFMPGTWAEVARQLRLGDAAPAHDVAIAAGAYYMARLRAQWSAPRPAEDRHRLAQASYNAGLGHLLAAQRACGGAAPWAAIAPCLPLVTGRHARETLDYVARIARWRAMIEAGL